MKITRIDRQKHRENRYSIFVDGEFAFGIGGVDLLYYKLTEGMEISAEQLNFVFDKVLFEKARDKAVRFLSYRIRSRKELEDKLKGEDFPERVIENVIEMLESYNYIDDQKFAEAYVDEKIRLRGYGKARLEQELREKGISREIIAEVLDEAEIDEVELALVHLEKKARGSRELDEKEKRRCVHYLQRRGFSYSVVKEAFSRYYEMD